MLPQEVANLISEMIPEPPSKHQEAEYAYPDESAAVVTTYQREDVLANQIGGEGRGRARGSIARKGDDRGG